MSIPFYGSREMLARKPPHGSPCNRCGLCCVATLCDLGAHFFGQPKDARGPCPALRIDLDTKESACALTLAGLTEYREAAALLIGSGSGCDCRVNGEPINPAQHERDRTILREKAAELAAARNLWGMPE